MNKTKQGYFDILNRKTKYDLSQCADDNKKEIWIFLTKTSIL